MRATVYVDPKMAFMWNIFFVGICFCHLPSITGNEHRCSEQISELKQTLEIQAEILNQQSDAIIQLQGDLERERATNIRQNEELTRYVASLQSLQNKDESMNTDNLARQRKDVSVAEDNVAFTAILTSDIDTLSPDQTIVFNHTILNLGSHYSEYTGAFIAPFDGIYSFTFFIGGRGATQIYADLYVNNQEIVSATTEGTHSLHDTQGGNSALVSLSVHDVVQVKHHLWGQHVEAGNAGTRATSFSGFLVFQTESFPGSSIIGK